MTNENKPSPFEEAIRNSVGNIYQCEDCEHTCKSEFFIRGVLDSIHCPECESMEVINQSQVAINACEEIHRERLREILLRLQNLPVTIPYEWFDMEIREIAHENNITL